MPLKIRKLSCCWKLFKIWLRETGVQNGIDYNKLLVSKEINEEPETDKYLRKVPTHIPATSTNLSLSKKNIEILGFGKIVIISNELTEVGIPGFFILNTLNGKKTRNFTNNFRSEFIWIIHIDYLLLSLWNWQMFCLLSIEWFSWSIRMLVRKGKYIHASGWQRDT